VLRALGGAEDFAPRAFRAATFGGVVIAFDFLVTNYARRVTVRCEMPAHRLN
jgi:hypothetical protein